MVRSIVVPGPLRTIRHPMTMPGGNELRRSQRELNQIIADAEGARRRKQMDKRPKPTPISPVILAEFPGTCERCAQPIRPGQAIVRARFWDRIEDWVHSFCSFDPDDPVVPAIQG